MVWDGMFIRVTLRSISAFPDLITQQRRGIISGTNVRNPFGLSIGNSFARGGFGVIHIN